MKLHRKIASWFGYELIKLRKSPSANSHLLNLINHYNIDTVLDVGANMGQFGLMLRDQGYKGTIHSFEPVSSSFLKLKKASENDKNWHIYNMALGDSAGELTINVAKASVFSSFLETNTFGQTRNNSTDEASKEIVQVSTVDLFFDENSETLENQNILLKMDTQGYDLNVFRGAVKSIPSISLLLSEISLINIYEGMPDYLDMLKTYQNNGFTASGFYPICRRPDFSVIEMDAMFINTRRL